MYRHIYWCVHKHIHTHNLGIRNSKARKFMSVLTCLFCPLANRSFCFRFWTHAQDKSCLRRLKRESVQYSCACVMGNILHMERSVCSCARTCLDVCECRGWKCEYVCKCVECGCRDGVHTCASARARASKWARECARESAGDIGNTIFLMYRLTVQSNDKRVGEFSTIWFERTLESRQALVFSCSHTPIFSTCWTYIGLRLCARLHVAHWCMYARACRVCVHNGMV